MDEEPAKLGFRTRARAYLRTNAVDIVNVVALGALALLVYGLDLDSIGIGGDAIRKWHFVRQWFYANDFVSNYRWDHHMARMGVNVITFIVQLLFGRSAVLYYAPALIAGVVAVMMTYATGKRLDGRVLGTLAALFLIAFKPAHTAATQLLPEVFSGTYALIATYFFVRYRQAPTGKTRTWLIAAGVATFVGYLAKETTVFFIPGLVLAILMVGSERKWRDAALFVGVFAVGVALETASYRVFTHYAHRFAIVAEVHVYDPNEQSYTFLGLLDRYEKADPSWRFAFYVFLPATLGVFAFLKNRAASAVAVVALVYFFFLTFLVRSLDPMIVWQSFHSRYLDCCAPFVLLTIALFLLGCWREVSARTRWPVWTERFAALSRFSFAAVPGLALVIGGLAFLSFRPKLEEHPFKLVPQMAKIVNDTYRRNLPLVSVRKPGGLWAAYSVLLSDRLLAKDGILPELDEVKLTWGGKTFLVRDPSVYDPDKFRRLERKHCALEVIGKEGYPYLKPMTALRPECDAELQR